LGSRSTEPLPTVLVLNERGAPSHGASEVIVTSPNTASVWWATSIIDPEGGPSTAGRSNCSSQFSGSG
jgi:hypothetical protein